ncbi:MAG: ABC transporter substrate-binding protein, partial [Methanophagales archaeon]|nr:ABC transporter substrate-binding protein [Methanophagales archaeon]
IVGKEKEITLIQRLTYKEYERAKTFNLPIKRIIALDDAEGEPLRVLGAEDLVVGVGSSLVTHDIILPEMSKLPNIGSLWGGSINYEKLLSLKPDLFMGSAAWPLEETEEKLESYGIQVFLDSCTTRAKDIIKVGYLVGKKDKAEEFYDFREGFLNEIKARTEGLSEDEKPRVYIEAMGRSYYTSCPAAWNKHDQMCTIAGGINIAHDLVGEKTFVNVDPEWVIAQNPDIIVKEASGGGYGIDDTTEMKAIRDEIMNRPELANINAVKGGNVYVVAGDLARSGQQGFMMAVYMAKWFHPDLFEDLDPKATHQEYIDRFLRIDYNLNEHGVFVYPEPS